MLHFVTIIVLMIVVAFTLLTVHYIKDHKRNPFTLNFWVDQTVLITINLGLIYILIRLILKLCV